MSTTDKTSSETQLTTVSFSGKDQAPVLQVNPEFTAILKHIPELVKHSNELLNQDLDQLDDSELSNVMSELRDAKRYNHDIDSARKKLRAYFRDLGDQAVAQLDEQLAKYQYSELESLSDKTRQLHNDQLADRANKRWAELKTTFEANLNLYPVIAKLAPQLANYDQYRVNHPKLVSGAKSSKITDKQRTVVSNEINGWSRDLLTIDQNDAQLTNVYQQQLINDYVANPTSKNLFSRLQYYKARKAADDQKLAQEQANAKAAREAAKAKAEAQAAAKQVAAQTPTAPVKPTTPNATQPAPVTPQVAAKPQPTLHATSDFGWLINIAFASPVTRDLTTNKAKASLAFEMVTGLSNPNSAYAQHIGQDPDKFVAALRYLLSL